MVDKYVCFKCKGERGPPTVRIRTDSKPLCKSCFLSGCVHKFRSSFGEANIVKNGESVALGFSGGASSLAMLFLSKMCQENKRHLRFQPTVICLYDDTQSYPNEQENLMRESGFEYRIVRTDQIFPNYKLPNVSGLKHVTNSALTAAAEVQRWRRLEQLKIVTLQILGFKYLMVGENASHLAASCLSGVAQARGGSVATELSFADARYGDVTILRPLYRFLANEVALFLKFSGLEPLIGSNMSALLNLEHGANSVQRLTQNFLSSLQFGGFPSTTMAILSSASKTLSDYDSSCRRCTVCHAPLEHSNNICDPLKSATAEAAYEFSALISRNAKMNCDSAQASLSPEKSSNLCTCCRVNFGELDRGFL
ncbi:hypothetical protein Aperf_G00000082521 [Anoplocephala perfoliata]